MVKGAETGLIWATLLRAGSSEGKKLEKSESWRRSSSSLVEQELPIFDIGRIEKLPS